MVVGRMILGAAIGLVLMFGGLMLEGGHVSSALQLTAFMIVAGGTGGFLIMGYPLRLQIRSIKLALTPRPEARPELHVARHYFSAMGSGFVMFGILGAVLGLIHVMENLDKPSQIGPGIAVAFIALLYGFLLRLFVANALGDAIAVQLTEDLESTEPSARARRPDKHAA